jgi:colanic acid biosynthesis protein WcaH
VSIDLVVENAQGQILLGERLNRPAKNYFFVPGGRILKDEPMSEAFKRLTLNELGQTFEITQAKLMGPFDHFYEDNVFGDGFSTHYVAIAYKLVIDADLNNLPTDEQHSGYRWFEVSELLASDRVHLHTKWYMDPTAS